VTGELVYVNYGVPKDYEVLERKGIDVRGRIVIARYGGSWRGIKPKVAAEHGAIGCILYRIRGRRVLRRRRLSEGRLSQRWKRATRIRGGHAGLFRRSADAGVGATAGAKRLAIKDATTLTKIPGTGRFHTATRSRSCAR